MPDFAGELVTIKAVNARDSLGNIVDDSTATAVVDVWNADQSEQYVTAAGMVWVTFIDPDSLETSQGWAYNWNTVGRDPGGPYLARVTITPHGGIGGVEWKELWLARPPLGPGRVTCGAPWVDPADMECLQSLSESDRELVVAAASRMLFQATARKFTGVCEDTFRPCDPGGVGGFGLSGPRLADGSLWLGWDGTSTLPESTFGPSGWVRQGLMGGGIVHSVVDFAEIGLPVVDVANVTIDGTPLDRSEYSIVDDRWIIRNHGRSWPLWQRLDRATGDQGTWSMTVSWGVDVPPDGVLAARVLACELAKAPAFLNDDTCRLPRRLQTITRENVTSVVIDPMKFLDNPKDFGLYEVNVFVRAENPYGISREAKVLNPDLLGTMPRRVR